MCLLCPRSGRRQTLPDLAYRPLRGGRSVELGQSPKKNKEPRSWSTAFLPGAEECPRPVLSLHPLGDLEAQGSLFLTAFRR